jgi:hypothetical protein
MTALKKKPATSQTITLPMVLTGVASGFDLSTEVPRVEDSWLGEPFPSHDDRSILVELYPGGVTRLLRGLKLPKDCHAVPVEIVIRAKGAAVDLRDGEARAALVSIMKALRSKVKAKKAAKKAAKR